MYWYERFLPNWWKYLQYCDVKSVSACFIVISYKVQHVLVLSIPNLLVGFLFCNYIRLFCNFSIQDYKTCNICLDQNADTLFWFDRSPGDDSMRMSQLNVGTSTDVSLKITETDLSSLTASIRAPSGNEEPCLLKRLPNRHIGQFLKIHLKFKF